MSYFRFLRTAKQRRSGSMRWAIGMTLIVLFANHAYSEATPIVLYASEYPPFYASHLAQQGVISDIVVTAFARTNLSVHVEFLPFRRGLTQIQEGRADGMFALWYSNERAQQLWFSDAIESNEIVLLRRIDDVRTMDPHNLHGLRIGNVRGYLPPDVILQQNIRLNEVSLDSQLLMMLAHNRLDAIIIDRWVANHLITTQMPELLGQVVAIEPPLERKAMHVVFSKTRSHSLALRDQFNDALQQLRDEGIIADILRRHGFEHDLITIAAKKNQPLYRQQVNALP